MGVGYHALRSSDMADGIQWVERMSNVAALAVFVWRTTICKNETIHVYARLSGSLAG